MFATIILNAIFILSAAVILCAALAFLSVILGHVIFKLSVVCMRKRKLEGSR